MTVRGISGFSSVFSRIFFSKIWQSQYVPESLLYVITSDIYIWEVIHKENWFYETYFSCKTRVLRWKSNHIFMAVYSMYSGKNNGLRSKHSSRINRKLYQQIAYFITIFTKKRNRCYATLWVFHCTYCIHMLHITLHMICNIYDT